MKLDFKVVFAVFVLLGVGFISLVSESLAEVSNQTQTIIIHLADSVNIHDTAPVFSLEENVTSSILNDYYTYKTIEHEINIEPFLETRNSFAGKIGE